MKNSLKVLVLLASALPFFAHASDGGEALERFHERLRASFAEQAKDIERHKQQALQAAEQQARQKQPDTDDSQPHTAPAC
ncbi:TPA: hypothetical protein ACKP22_005425 [Pseudomonas putida]